MTNTVFSSVWEKLTKELSLEISSKWKNTVITMYSEPQRHYHTLKHVEEMLTYRQENASKLEDLDAVDYAVIFHDIVYDPKAADNEEKSADLFSEFLKECTVMEPFCDKVNKMILATKLHTTPEHSNGTGGAQDLHFLLDFDMAVLGRPASGYKEYADQIRQEYIHIPEKVYCFKRAEVLTTFLKVPYIFGTADFRNSHENQARLNIQDEINTLTQKAASL